LQISKKYGIDSSECVYVGDEVNDVPVFGKTGLSIAFNCSKQKVKDAADIVIDGNDLRLILPSINGDQPIV